MVRQSKRKPNLLLVDGPGEELARGQESLADSGFSVHRVRDGADALERLAHEPFDLVLLDAETRGNDGLALLRSLRSAESTAELPVILVTPPGGEETQVQAFALGADDCIPKPLDWKITAARIRARLRPRLGPPRHPEPPLAGRYRLESLLGRGRHGTVWRALDLETGRAVAVKRLAALASAEDRERFAREGPILCRIAHPHAVAVHDLCDDRRSPALVMELLEGLTLEELLRQGPLPPHRIAAILGPVCSMLECVHSHGIVHCDLKPGNVFLHRQAGEEVPKVLDFGIARWQDGSSRQRRNGLPAGTPAYLAPERIAGAPYDGRADVYSLGVMLYEMLTGTLPFTVEDGNILRLLHLHTHRAPPPLGPAVPPGLRRLVERCLSKEPKERPEIQELGRILTGDFGTGDLLTG